MNNQWKLVNDKMEYTNMYLDTLHYGEIPEDVKITFQNFQYAIDTFANKDMRPQVRYTAFHKNPYLFFHIDGGFDYWTMHKRTFKPFVFRVHYWKSMKSWTFKELMTELPADEFAEYCKDHRLSVVMEN